MKTVFKLLLPLLLCLATLNAVAQEVGGPPQRMHSTVLDEDRTFRVQLPDSYGWAQDRKYPVLVVLDGQSDFLHSAVSAQFLAANGEIPEMIVVGIDSTKRVRDFTQSDWPEMWVGGGGAENFRRFLATELLPAIDGAYRTDGYRILSGHSASGQFALYCLSVEPALFQAYIALSSSLDWDHNLPQRALEKSFASGIGSKAFLYVARSNDFGQALADYDQLVEVLKTKAPKGFRWFSQPYPDETHTSLSLLAQYDALRHVYAGYRFNNDLLDKGLPFVEQHFADVSKTVGWKLPVPEAVINDLGYAALSQQRVADAIALFKRNVDANPNSANAHDSLADGYAEAKDWDNAKQAADKAVVLATRYKLSNLADLTRHAEKLKSAHP